MNLLCPRHYAGIRRNARLSAWILPQTAKAADAVRDVMCDASYRLVCVFSIKFFNSHRKL